MRCSSRGMIVKPIGLSLKVSLAIAVVAIVSLAILSSLAVTSSRQSLREQVLSANFTAATLVAKAVERYVADVVSIMREAPGRPKLSQEIRTANWFEASRDLENFLRNFLQFDYVFVQDSQGIIRVRVPHAETVGQDFSFREFFHEVMKTRRLTISGVYVSQAAQRAVVSIAVPVLDGDAVKGVLVGAMSLTNLSQFVSTIGREDPSVLYVVDRNGLLIAHSRGVTSALPEDMKDQPIVQAVLTGKSGTREFQDPGTGEQFLGAHVPIATLGWGVVAVQPLSEAYAAPERLGRWLLWVALACTAVAVVLGWQFGRTLTGPVLRLAEATRRMASGDLTARVTPESEDEVGALAVAFNSMAERLQESYRDLERRVEERTRELLVKTKELEAFTYTVAHDLRAPLRGIDGFSTVLLEDYADKVDDAGRHCLKTVRDCTKRMGALIDDLLRYCRVERRTMRRTRMELPTILDHILHNYRQEIASRGVALKVDLPFREMEGEVEGFVEVLANLVDNALKFTRGVPHPEILVRGEENETEWVLSIADNGIGFDPQYREKIFEIFQRLNRQEDYDGTGVGLAIVRKVAERHGGRAWAESQPGKGSVFSLAIPKNSGESPRP